MTTRRFLCLALVLLALAFAFGGEDGDADARPKACYWKAPEEGVEGAQGAQGAHLAIQFTITKEQCRHNFIFVANVLDPLVYLHQCTGVLVDKGLVAVPASCVHGKTQKDIPLVRTNSYDVNDPDELRPDFDPEKSGFSHPEGTSPKIEKLNSDRSDPVARVCKVIVHDKFNGDVGNGNNIALLQLNSTELPAAQAISEWTSADKCPQEDLSAIGWFASMSMGVVGPKLGAIVNMTYVNDTECGRVLGKIPEGAICVEPDITAQYMWDLGALLLCNDKKLLGFATHTIATHNIPRQVRAPYAFTHVSHYRDWIASRGKDASKVLLNPHEDCKEALTPEEWTSVEQSKTTDEGGASGRCEQNDEGDADGRCDKADEEKTPERCES
eukprot:evm.model.scf_643.1 EVM.evm.TU.scf_643.1   scf_643:10163-15473(+)